MHKRWCLALVAGLLLAGTPPTPAGARGGSEATAATGDSLSPEQARELTDRALARHGVRERLGRGRIRFVRGGLAPPEKTGRRIAVLYLRNTDRGTAYALSVDLMTGAVAMRQIVGLLQPSPEEIAEARAILARDPALAPLFANPRLTLQGGFHTHSPDPADPCSRDVCLELAFMEPGFEKDPARRVIVNLTRGAVGDRDFRAPRRTGSQ